MNDFLLSEERMTNRIGRCLNRARKLLVAGAAIAALAMPIIVEAAVAGHHLASI